MEQQAELSTGTLRNKVGAKAAALSVTLVLTHKKVYERKQCRNQLEPDDEYRNKGV